MENNLNYRKNEYVWYAGYGSNLCRERFLCYVTGGRYRLGGKETKGCTDKTLPQDSKALKIPYKLYFARSSTFWDNGGVAFINLEKEMDSRKWTFSSMWKITRGQFDEVKQQEGASWYDHTLCLGIDGGIPIMTITSKTQCSLNRPSENYLLTIAIGLKETYRLNAKETYDYLYKKDGVRGCYREDELWSIVNRLLSEE